jgi:uncharacterized membrane protein
VNKHRLVSPFNWLLIALVAVVTGLGFVLVPLDQDFPTHWDASGTVDGLSPAPVALILPLAILAGVIGLLYVMRAARLKRDFASGRFVLDASIGGLAGMMLVLSVANVLYGMGYAVDIQRIVLLAVTVLMILIGNALPKSQKNFVAGIRLPWTLRDAANWRITHRWAGRSMVVCGLIAFVAIALGVPNPWPFAVVMASIIVPAGIATVVSYTYALRHGEAQD